MTDSVRIASGNSVCTLLPKTGGSIGSWRVDGQAMLRTALDGTDPLQSASFPLVPYSNRIANARFDWHGTPVVLRPHPIAAPHAIHGVGWLKAWDVTKINSDSATLTLNHNPDADWPWPFEAEQHIAVGENWLWISMTIRNLSDVPVPAAFGHHCYFDCQGASIKFMADRFFPSGPDMLPLEAEAVAGPTDFSGGCAVTEHPFDNGFGGWDGKAELSWAERGHRLLIESDMTNVVLFTPSGEDFFCFEPVPHRNNALCRADGDMPLVAPGGLYQSHIRFTAVAA